jgi:acetylornithine deacetylase/succinyl-diaminopimelate desuccinylase-like protein
MDFKRAQQRTADSFSESIVPRLCDYIRIPNKSPLFDANWQKNGYMDRAAELMAEWCREQPIDGLTVEILRAKGRTPLLFCEVPGSGKDTALLYGHMDKQPEFTGWAAGLSPWEPVLRDGKLYGRGGADDGYAVFSSLTAIRLLQEQGIPHARCVVLIEACEESGSYDLPCYVDQLAARIGTPSLRRRGVSPRPPRFRSVPTSPATALPSLSTARCSSPPARRRSASISPPATRSAAARR